MTIADLFQFLGFDRMAIHKIAACKHAIWIGLLLVLSAGFAREYDGEDLLHEPWHLLIPVGASLLTSWLLYTVVYVAARRHQMPASSYWQHYRIFLSLYWMTAPLAWLYAIPVERFLSAGDATQVNLWLLGIVSLWRVALMMRVVSVLFKAPFATVFGLVMFFADTVALVALVYVPVPVLSVMGGVRLSDSEQLMQSTKFLVQALGFGTWLLWAIWTVVIFATRWPAWGLNSKLPDADQSCSRSCWVLTACALLLWVPILALTQPEQQLRHRAESLLYAGQVEEALKFMSTHERAEFPRHWDAPPRVAYGEEAPPLMDVVEQLKRPEVRLWVRELYQQKFADELPKTLSRWDENEEVDIARRIAELEASPNKFELVKPLRYDLLGLVERPGLSEALKERIKALLASTQEDHAPREM